MLRLLTNKRSLVTLLFLLYWGSSVVASETTISSKFEVPAHELKEIVMNWFKHYGYHTTLNATNSMTKITATFLDERWYVEIKPHSPLAAQIKLLWKEESTYESSKIHTLFRHIKETVDPPPVKPRKYAPVEAASPYFSFVSRLEAVVCIQAKDGENEYQSTGFVVDPEGLILSTAHDLKPYSQITILLKGGEHLPGHLLAYDYEKDLAMIEVKKTVDFYITLARSRRLLREDENIYAIGCPQKINSTILNGTIDGPPRQVAGLPLWQVAMEIHPGSSGSPVFDKYGNFSGVIKGRYKGTETVGFLIPLDTVLSFITKMGNK